LCKGLARGGHKFVSRGLETGSDPFRAPAPLPAVAALTSPAFRAN
jgi:hypothetical protein